MRSDLPNSIEKESLLLVEGDDDKAFWESFLSFYGHDGIQILEHQGRDNLQHFLPAVMKTPNFGRVKWLGICQDADGDARAAFQRIQGVLRRSSLHAPVRSWVTGNGHPQVVAFVFPDGSSEGDLEALLWQSVQHEPLGVCVQEFLRCVDQMTGELPQPASKAHVYAYLAACNPPGWRLRQAARYSRFDYRHSVFQRIIDLLPGQSQRSVIQGFESTPSK